MKNPLKKAPKQNSREVGNLKEKLALRYLKKRGFTLIQQNYHCRYGEIDLIVEDNKCTVFVEVRYRAQKTHGGAAISVTPSKQTKLIKSAEDYLQKNSQSLRKMCRIDVIAIDGNEIQWIPNAVER